MEKNYWKISKEYSFESSHVVHTQELEPKKCRSLHGHSYQLCLTLVGCELNNEKFILDYGYFDKIIKDEIDKIDHSYIYGETSDMEIVDMLKRKKLRTYNITYEPTAENISKYFAELVSKNNIIKNINCLYEIICEVKETRKTSCVYHLKLQKN